MEYNNGYLTDRAMNSGIKRGSMKLVDGFLEVRCPLCGEFLPHTSEFFYKDSKVDNSLKSRCIPCFVETRHHSQIPKTKLVGRPPKKSLKNDNKN